MQAALPIRLKGKITRFSGNGRRLGYPTANLKVQTSLIEGVYFGYADLGEYLQHPALIFIGIPVTIRDPERRVEAHLLDIMDVDYYNLLLKLDIRYFHRNNKKFGSISELTKAMQKDEKAARRWFKKQDQK